MRLIWQNSQYLNTFSYKSDGYVKINQKYFTIYLFKNKENNYWWQPGCFLMYRLFFYSANYASSFSLVATCFRLFQNVFFIISIYMFPQFLFDAFISLIRNGKDTNIVSVMPKKPCIPPRAQVQEVLIISYVLRYINSGRWKGKAICTKQDLIEIYLRI